jgi:hypothetical protein
MELFGMRFKKVWDEHVDQKGKTEKNACRIFRGNFWDR